MKVLFTFFFLLIVKITMSQELPPDANTLLLLHFNNSVNGATGEIPVSSSNISYAPGKHGSALQINSNTTLRFDTTQNLNPRQGTLEFWIKPTSEGAIMDMGIGGGLSAQVGNFTRMIFNIFGINGNPEVGVFGNSTIWNPTNTWRHYAFTWENRTLKLYYNGSLFTSSTINFDIPNVNLTYFNIGSTINGTYQSQGLLDELRISNRARTPFEICQSYVSGQITTGITNLAVRNNHTITLYKSWNIYLERSGYWEVPSLYALNGTDTVNISNTCVSWSVSNTSIADISNGVLTAKLAGNTILICTIGTESVQIPLLVTNPVLQPDKPANIDPFLTTPASCHTTIIPVVAIVYLPTNDGINLNTTETGNVPGIPQTIDAVKQRILQIYTHTKFSLEEGSKFRGYANSNAKPYLGYKIVDYIFVYEPLPLSIQDNPTIGNYWVDYYQIMERHRGKYYVDTLGVKEIWLMGYHTDRVSPLESNMSSPTTGNISNSYRREDDLPKYENTFIVYNYNMTRGGNEATHNHGHQAEAMLSHVAAKQDGNANLFNINFRGYPSSGGGGPIGRCGDTHHPPNTTVDYDYNNTTLVASDIMDWKPAGGTTTMINNNTWGNINYPWPAILFPSLPPVPESNWYIFWMQSMPGNGNQIPSGSRWMTNWWRFMSDWDSNTVKIGLYQNTPEILQTSCVPYISTGLGSTSVCIGGSMTLNYYSSNVIFNTGNVFTVQLSNATGNFDNPVIVGTLSSTSANGIININIPSTALPGNSYRLRIVSSNPVVTSDASNLLEIKSPPTPAINANGSTSFCQGGNVTLTSNAASGNQWYKDGIAIGGATGTTLNVTASGSYTTKVTVNGCESAASNAIVVTVSPVPPTPTISAGGTTTFCQGGSVTLTSNAAGGNQWYKDGISIGGATAVTLNATSSGSYITKVTVGGCESAVSNPIIVTVNPAPSTPTVTAGSATTFCTGGSVTLTSNTASGNQWYKDGVAIGGATSTTLNVTTSGSYTTKVTVSGCESAISNAIVVIVNPSPSAPAVTAGSATTFCQGGSVILTSNAASGNQWYKDGIAIGGATGTTLNVIASGSYTAKVTASGCESVASNAIVVTVSSIPPTPTISAGGTTTFCQGGSVLLTSSATNGNQWYKDGVAIGGSTGTTLLVIASGSYTTKVIVTGCESAISNAIVVTVNPGPSTPTVTAGSATTFCTGGSVNLTSNAASGNQWYKDGIAIGGATGTTLNVIASGSYTAKVTASGCESVASNAIVVTVSSIPPTPTISAGGTTTFCQGGSVLLTSSATNGNQWYKDGVAIGGSTGTTLLVIASGSYTTKVIVTGCESAISNAIVVTVNPGPSTPTVTAGSATTFCTGSNVTLTSNAASGNQWYKDGIAIGGATGTTLNVIASGSYTAKVTASGCTSNSSNAIAVTVNPIPATPTITQNGNQLTSSVVSGNQWYLNNNLIAGAVGQTYNPTASGSYTVQVTLSNCSSVFSFAFDFIMKQGSEIKVFPNPVSDQLVVTQTGIPTTLNIRIIDITGKELMTLDNSSSRIEINMSKYATGIYIIEIENKDRNIKEKKLFVKL